MRRDLPGEEFAREQGYELYSFSSDRRTARWTKGDLCLVTYYALGVVNGRLEKVLGLVMAQIEPFTIPNKNFQILEKAIQRVVLAEE